MRMNDSTETSESPIDEPEEVSSSRARARSRSGAFALQACSRESASISIISAETDRRAGRRSRSIVDRKAVSKSIVYDVLEQPAALPRRSLQRSREIVIERDRRPHNIMMLGAWHHNVNLVVSGRLN